MFKLSDLFFKSKGIKIPSSYFEKKYDTSYTGKSYFGFMAVDSSGEAIAFYGQFPCLISIEGQKHLACQVGDVITRPDYQKKGLFTLLGKTASQFAKEQGVNFLFCVPNENSKPGFIKSLGWRTESHFKIFEWRVKTLPVYRILHKLRIPFIYGVYLNIFKFIFSQSPQQFIGQTQKNEVFTVFKREDYIQYKKYNSNFLIRWKGIGIWAKIDGRLVIGEIDFENKLSALEIIAKLKSLARVLGIERIVFEIQANSKLFEIFSEEFQSTEGLSICYHSLNKKIEGTDFTISACDPDPF